jgi:tetratricopeptide (TPR) repeat protein
MADFDQAIRLNGAYAHAFLGRGYVWHRKQQLDKAIADYDQAIRLDPSEYLALVNRGMIWAEKKQYKKAIADYDAAIRLNPRAANIYDYRGFAWSELQEPGRAIADYAEAIRLDSNDVFAHISTAWLLANCPDQKIRDGERAIASAMKACELSGWKVPNYLETLASAYAEAGDFDTAVKWQTKANALQSDPKAKQAGEELLRFLQDAESSNESWDQP